MTKRLMARRASIYAGFAHTVAPAERSASRSRSGALACRHMHGFNVAKHAKLGAITLQWNTSQGPSILPASDKVDYEDSLRPRMSRYYNLYCTFLISFSTAAPGDILLESMQVVGGRPGQQVSVAALDFERVRQDLASASEHQAQLLLQALRHRLTRITTGNVRQAVVTSYVRGDVIGIRQPPDPEGLSLDAWTRLSESLLGSGGHDMLAQATARFLNALTAFQAGRTYLASSSSVTRALLGVIIGDHGDPAATDMALAALQKLSIRSGVQEQLVSNGCLEWLSKILADARSLPPYTLEYAVALFMNLSLRTQGRMKCVQLSIKLLPALTQLLATVPHHVVPYVTGALYSLVALPPLRREAFDLGLDATLDRLAKGSNVDQRRQIEYIVQHIRRDAPPSPPPSPEPAVDAEEDPEFLEEELDLDDPVRGGPTHLTGEELLAWRYALHPGEAATTIRGHPVAPTRSAPMGGHHTRPLTQDPQDRRPNTDGHLQPQQQQSVTTHSWDYPSDSDSAGVAGDKRRHIRKNTRSESRQYWTDADQTREVNSTSPTSRRSPITPTQYEQRTNSEERSSRPPEPPNVDFNQAEGVIEYTVQYSSLSEYNQNPISASVEAGLTETQQECYLEKVRNPGMREFNVTIGPRKKLPCSYHMSPAPISETPAILSLGDILLNFMDQNIKIEDPNKSRSIAGPYGQPDSYCWPEGQQNIPVDGHILSLVL
ncbi:unnamed protein product, partial [Meganyctiphanes norvegica]